mgnify:CR=1 FL=1
MLPGAAFFLGMSYPPAREMINAGLGVALLTTMVGLVGNIVLGLQLTRLDRYADALISDCQRAGLTIGRDAGRGG